MWLKVCSGYTFNLYLCVILNVSQKQYNCINTKMFVISFTLLVFPIDIIFQYKFFAVFLRIACSKQSTECVCVCVFLLAFHKI